VIAIGLLSEKIIKLEDAAGRFNNLTHHSSL
jgi:hypothetical protein